MLALNSMGIQVYMQALLICCYAESSQIKRYKILWVLKFQHIINLIHNMKLKLLHMKNRTIFLYICNKSISFTLPLISLILKTNIVSFLYFNDAVCNFHRYKVM